MASESELYIFSDGPRLQKKDDILKVENVRKYLRTVTGFKRVTINESTENKGLASSVIAGVSEVLEKHDRVIVIEDDIVSSTDFLKFMNEALSFYENDEQIWSVTGYCPPIKIPKNYPFDVFLTLRPSSWGWGTWKNRWEKIDWEIKDYPEMLKDRKKQRAFNKGGNDLFGMLKNQMEGNIDSWAIRWSYNQFRFGCYSIYPVHTRINHIGVGEDATHIKRERHSQQVIDDDVSVGLERNLVVDKTIMIQMRKQQMSKLRRWARNLTMQLGIYTILYVIWEKLKPNKL